MMFDINRDGKIDEILRLAEEKGVKIIEQTRAQLEKISGDIPHQGVIAKVDLTGENLTEEYLQSHPGLYVYVREAQDDHNVGAIIRTAEAAGIQGVIVAPKQELTGTVARTSMGAIFHLPIFSASLFPCIKMFKQQAHLVSAIEINGSKSIFDSNLADGGLLIVGGEDRSISDEIAAQCDQLINIPQFGKVNSLNMSVAAAIAMYEHVRQLTTAN
jgi:23S rRNA (guanosine2251-2'-O)-methyltransferase